jgi:hypothetical protein
VRISMLSRWMLTIVLTVYIQRYDFFYKNGVPKWRGTGYYYSRYRPGLGVSTHHPC